MGNSHLHTSKDDFLKALGEVGTVSGAAASIGVSRRTPYNWREDDAEFAAQWDAVIDAETDKLEKVAFERAVDGSDTLLIFLLKSRRPEKYAQPQKKEVHHSGQIDSEQRVTLVTDGELDRFERVLRERFPAAGNGNGNGTAARLDSSRAN